MAARSSNYLSEGILVLLCLSDNLISAKDSCLLAISRNPLRKSLGQSQSAAGEQALLNAKLFFLSGKPWLCFGLCNQELHPQACTPAHRQKPCRETPTYRDSKLECLAKKRTPAHIA
jgi:hypothetical protein